MDKPIRFDGMNCFAIPKCRAKSSTIMDDSGNETIIIHIEILTDEYIQYSNNKKLGMITDASPNKDVISALMELSDEPSDSEVCSFFNAYGFFINHPKVSESKYIKYNFTSIKNYIHFIKKLIKLTGYSSIYNSTVNKNFLNMDYNEICNLLIEILFANKFSLDGYMDSENININKPENILGYRFRNDLEKCYAYYKWPNLEPIFREPTEEDLRYYYETHEQPNMEQIGKIPKEPFEDYIYYCINGKNKPYSNEENFDPLYMATDIYNHPEIEIIKYIDCLIMNNKINYTEEINDYWDPYTEEQKKYTIPFALGLNDNDETSRMLQEKLFHTISLVINDQINRIIKEVHPEIQTNDEQPSAQISWRFNNLLCVIFMELASMETGGFECRCCCKNDCPIKGSYYFIIDAKNNSRTCYDQKCRNKINKRIFDKKIKK